MFPHTWAKGGVHFFGLKCFRRSNCFIPIRDPNSYKTVRGSFLYCQIVYSVILYEFVLYNSYKNCMNWYKNHIVYEFVLYNLYNNCMNYIVWIRTKTTLTNSTYMNSYKSVGWNSKKKQVWKNGGSPLSPRYEGIRR